MATFSTGTSNFTDLVVDLVRKTAEEELRANLVHAQADQVDPVIWQPGTNVFRLPRYADVAAATVALTEGTVPSALSLTVDSEAFTATQYGAVFELTDLALAYSPHDLIAINAERAGRQAALTYDRLCRDIIVAGTSVQFIGATSRATLAASNVITGAKVKEMVARLTANNVPRFKDGTFRSIIHPYTGYDLFSDTAEGGWMDASKYAANGPLLRGELGQYHGVRFMESTEAYTEVDGGAGSVDAFSSTFYGPRVLARGDVQGLAAYFVPAGGDHADPIGQMAKIGWKHTFGVALQDLAGPRYIRLEHAASLASNA